MSESHENIKTYTGLTPTHNPQQDYIASLEAQVAALREVLSALYAVQNGSPLPSYERDWNEAIRLTQQALKEAQP